MFNLIIIGILLLGACQKKASTFEVEQHKATKNYLDANTIQSQIKVLDLGDAPNLNVDITSYLLNLNQCNPQNRLLGVQGLNSILSFYGLDQYIYVTPTNAATSTKYSLNLSDDKNPVQAITGAEIARFLAKNITLSIPWLKSENTRSILSGMHVKTLEKGKIVFIPSLGWIPFYHLGTDHSPEGMNDIEMATLHHVLLPKGNWMQMDIKNILEDGEDEDQDKSIKELQRIVKEHPQEKIHIFMTVNMYEPIDWLNPLDVISYILGRSENYIASHAVLLTIKDGIINFYDSNGMTLKGLKEVFNYSGSSFYKNLYNVLAKGFDRQSPTPKEQKTISNPGETFGTFKLNTPLVGTGIKQQSGTCVSWACSLAEIGDRKNQRAVKKFLRSDLIKKNPENVIFRNIKRALETNLAPTQPAESYEKMIDGKSNTELLDMFNFEHLITAPDLATALENLIPQIIAAEKSNKSSGMQMLASLYDLSTKKPKSPYIEALTQAFKQLHFSAESMTIFTKLLSEMKLYRDDILLYKAKKIVPPALFMQLTAANFAFSNGFLDKLKSDSFFEAVILEPSSSEYIRESFDNFLLFCLPVLEKVNPKEFKIIFSELVAFAEKFRSNFLAYPHIHKNLLTLKEDLEKKIQKSPTPLVNSEQEENIKVRSGPPVHENLKPAQARGLGLDDTNLTTSTNSDLVTDCVDHALFLLDYTIYSDLQNSLDIDFFQNVISQ